MHPGGRKGCTRPKASCPFELSNGHKCGGDHHIEHCWLKDPSKCRDPKIRAAIERKIAEELSPEVLVVNDDSEKHATHKGLHDGHAGVRSNESHFSVTVVSEAFAGMTPIKRHRMVYAILQKEFDDGLHALQLSTKTPAEWAKTNSK